MPSHRTMIAVAVLALAAALEAQEAVGFPADAPEPWRNAARTIAARRGVEAIELSVDEATKLRDQVARRSARSWVLVAPPSGIDHNRHRLLLDAFAAVDADPFIDAAFGYVTGRTPEEALGFYERATAKGAGQATIGLLGVSDGGAARAVESILPVGSRRIPFVSLMTQPKADGTPDLDFIRGAWPRLKGRGVVILGGHGFPDRIVGGPGGGDVVAADFSNAIVLNIACFNGVTGRWFNPNGPNGGVVEMNADPEKAMALAILQSGAKAHVASLSVRPAGPELLGEAADLFSRGLTLGELRRRDYDRVVLAALELGHERLPLRRDETGRAASAGDFAKDVMLDWGTGMALFGDPSLRPYEASPGDEVVTVAVETSAGAEATVRLSQRGDTVGFAGPDPLVPWDATGTASMRLWARIPWDRGDPAGVELERVRIGRREIDGVGHYALEEDGGRRFLHLKVRYSQKEVLAERFLGLLQVTADLRVKLTETGRGRSHGAFQKVRPTTQPSR